MPFQAGAIVGELRLNTQPFQQGLRSAQGGIRGFLADSAKFTAGMIGAQVAIGAARRAFDSFTVVVRDGVRAIDELRSGTASLAAALQTFDPSRPFSETAKIAEQVLLVVERLDRQFVGTGQELQLLVQAMAMFGVNVNLATKAGQDQFVAFANLIKLQTQGQNFQIQAFQEIRALAEGTVTPSARLVQILRAQGVDVAKMIPLWKAQGVLIEEIVKRTQGYQDAMGLIENTIETQRSTLQSLTTRVLRAGMQRAYEDILGVLKTINGALQDQDGNLTALGQQVAGVLRGAWEAVRSVVMAIWGFLSGPALPVLKAVWSVVVEVWNVFSSVASVIREIWNQLAVFVVPVLKIVRDITLEFLEAVRLALHLLASGARLVRRGFGALRGEQPEEGPLEASRRPSEQPSIPSQLIPPRRSDDQARKAGQVNKALQEQLRLHELINVKTSRGIEAQIADLERIRRVYTKTAEERQDLELRIERLRVSLRDKQFRDAMEDAERSRQFIRVELEGREKSADEIAAAYARLYAKLKAIRTTDADQAKQKADAIVQLEREAIERLLDVRRETRDTIEELTLDEFEVRRRGIEREAEGQRRAAAIAIRLGRATADELIAIERAKNLRLEALERERIARFLNLLEDARTRAREEAEEAERAAQDLFARGGADFQQALADRAAALAHEIGLMQTRGATQEQILRREAEGLRETARLIEERIAKNVRLVETGIAGTSELVRENDALRRMLEEVNRQLERMGISLQALRNAGNPFAGFIEAAREALSVAVSWKDTWTQAIADVKGALSSALQDIARGTKTIWEGIVSVIQNVLDRILARIADFLADQIVNDFLSFLTRGAGAGGGGGGGFFGFLGRIFGFASGGTIRGGGLTFGATGFVARAPMLAAIAERSGMTEIVQPLPRGLRPEVLARWVERGASVNEGPVSITYAGDLHFAAERDLYTHARAVGDSVRWARRANHPSVRDQR